jgi:hypothetical protein
MVLWLVPISLARHGYVACHPAAAARFPAIRRSVQRHFRQLKTLARSQTAAN